MAFIRKRLSSNDQSRGTIYSYQLIETYRDGGKVKQRVICNLGGCATVEEALQCFQQRLDFERTISTRGGPEFGWCFDPRLSPEEVKRQQAQWQEDMAAEVAACEKRIAILEDVVSKSSSDIRSS
jgi:hypothetical protein